ncbi:MAG: protein translocase subunit SecF [Candidatus Limnocylindrales bacterium]
MFDIIGKRRWFYAFSLLITIPGLIFILLTPITGGKEGLKFSIDFTGGTVWEVHFKNGTPTVPQVQTVMAAQNLPGTAAITNSNNKDYVLIRTIQIGLAEFPVATPVPSPSATPAASGSPAESGSPGASGSSSPAASATPTAAPSASTSPAPSASAGASAGASPAPSPSENPIGLPTEGRLADLRFALERQFGPIDEVRQEASIGPIISGELTQQAIILFVLGSIGILAWMTFRFADFRMGVSALVALVHDIIVVVGIFAVLGTFVGLQIDALFVTAMLTVIGFSVHDTIVVFDRVRENKIRHSGEPFSAIVNHSLLQTVGRSLNTSLTTIMVLTALLLFGADSIRSFVFAMVIGIISGTYSSIFNASALLVTWHEWSEARRQREFATVRGR